MSVSVTGKFRSGKNSRLVVGSTNLNYSDYDFTETSEDIDTTNFESAAGGSTSYDEGTIGPTSIAWNAKGSWDAGRNPFDSPPGFYTRDDLANLKMYQNLADNTFLLMALARVLSAKVAATAKSTTAVSFDASGKSQGSFVRSTGSV